MNAKQRRKDRRQWDWMTALETQFQQERTARHRELDEAFRRMTIRAGASLIIIDDPLNWDSQ